MTPADQYRALAADCEARANRERVPEFHREWEFLARSYKRLALQAERDGLATTIAEACSKVSREWLDERPGASTRWTSSASY